MTAHPSDRLAAYRPWLESAPIDGSTSLLTAISVYVESLAEEGVRPNTVAAFDADLRLFATTLDDSLAVGNLTADHLTAFRACMISEGPAQCSPASMRRRLTSVQSFYRHLAEAGILPQAALEADLTLAPPPNPEPASAPTPTQQRSVAPRATTRARISSGSVAASVIADEELDAMLAAAEEEARAGDWRPMLLLSLLLDTGMSKAECLALTSSDVDLEARTVSVGEGDSKRTLELTDRVADAYSAYMFQDRRQGGRVFNCTGRNLEYVLARLGRAAGMERNPSFRSLRATAAARMHREGAEGRDVAASLGISRHTWPALRRRIRETIR